jgi:hypothetical protein
MKRPACLSILTIPMRIWFGVEVPLALVPNRNVLGQLAALSYEAKEVR